MIACYDSDVLFYAGLSIGLWIASVVGMGCAMLPFRKKSYADQIEEMMFEHIVQQLRGINIAEAYEVESEDSDSEEQEQEQEQEQVESDEESEAQEQEESEESTDADNEEEQEQDIEYVEETQIDNLPDHVEEPPAPVEAPLLSESSDDSARPSKRARRGRGRGRGHT